MYSFDFMTLCIVCRYVCMYVCMYMKEIKWLTDSGALNIKLCMCACDTYEISKLSWLLMSSSLVCRYLVT